MAKRGHGEALPQRAYDQVVELQAADVSELVYASDISGSLIPGGPISPIRSILQLDEQN